MVFTAAQFTCFKKLPIELRLMIRRYAVFNNRLGIGGLVRLHIVALLSIAAKFFVNRGAEGIAKKAY